LIVRIYKKHSANKKDDISSKIAKYFFTQSRCSLRARRIRRKDQITLKDQLSHLYQKFLNGTCTDNELELLFNYFETADPEELKAHILMELQTPGDDSSPDEKEAERLGIVQQLIKKQINARSHKYRRLFYRIVAAAILLISFSVGINFIWHKSHNQPILADNHKSNKISPGLKQATLTLANGKKIILTNSMAGTLALQGNTSIQINKNTGIVYKVNKPGPVNSVSYNTLTTARGEQSPYPLILPDGSKVWLNAASSITFPTAFTGPFRIVKISGEAYFEVVHNNNFPFEVITEKTEIKDMGTHFNVRSYSDDSGIVTTLLEGSVKVSDLSSGKSSVLVPGQQSRLNKGSHDITIEEANIDEVMAWKNGYFMFDNQRISSIMKSISRWYDVEIDYNNFNNTERFGGTFSRSSNLADILNNLSSLGKVHFKIDKRKIVVSN